MKKIHFLTLMILFTFFSISCKKNITDTDVIPTVDTTKVSVYPKKAVQVILPMGSSLNLTTTTAISVSLSSKVEANGNTEIAYLPGTNEMAWLNDKDDNLMLIGFISDHNDKISIRSTAQVLLYYALGTYLLRDTIKTILVKESINLPGFTDFEKKLEQLFIADPLVFKKGGFTTVLKEYAESLIKHNTVGLRQILIENPGAKSGLQVNENDFKTIKISNLYLRRAHAFIYKMSFKDKNGIETILKSQISPGDDAQKDVKIKPTGAIREVIGTVNDLLQGKGMDYALSETDPIELPLADNESEAKYNVRAIGIGRKENTPFTGAEQKKYDQLVVEFFTMDVLLPVIMDALSAKSFKDGIFDDPSSTATLDEILKITGSFINSVPAAKDALEDGDYKKALIEFFTAVANNGVGQMGDIIELIMKAYFNHLANTNVKNGAVDLNLAFKKVDALNKLKRVMQPLALADLILKSGNYLRMFIELTQSNKLEAWTVKAAQSTVRIEPRNHAVLTLTDLNLQVYVKSTIVQGTVFEYEWSVTGKYGKIRDAVGHNATSFTSSADKVIYRSTVSSSNLPDNAEEKVIVTVYIREPNGNRIKVDTDTTTFRVTGIRHEIKPNGITLTGKKEGTKSVGLYIQRTDGVFLESTVLDWKIEWSTAGVYGKFNGRTKNVTTTGKGTVAYECLDDQTKEAIENITAKLYVRTKGDVEWTFFEEVKGTVKINNDPKKKIIHVGAALYHFEETNSCPSSQPGCNICYKATVAYVPEEKDAISYSIRFFGQSNPNGYTSQSWTPTNLSFYGPSFGKPKYSGGEFTVVYDWTSQGSLAGNLTHANHVSSGGLAEVIIILK